MQGHKMEWEVQESMHIITRKRLNQYAVTHPQAKPGLIHWATRMKAGTYHNLSELRVDFPTADPVGRLFVFNIGGNTYRLITAIHFNRQKNLYPCDTHSCGIR
jgi:mRNA interferase HigB